jgi:hypothetical protein
MKQKTGSQLSAAVEKLRCRLLVDRGIDDGHAGRIAGAADVDGFGVRDIYAAVPARPIIAGAKRNGIDNFTGNSLSHFITPTITIVAETRC